MAEPTLGERRVRVSFNPSEDSLVNLIKMQTAALIDLCELHKHDAPKQGDDSLRLSEAIRYWALAQTHFEDAAMWAVKAATATL